MGLSKTDMRYLIIFVMVVLILNSFEMFRSMFYWALSPVLGGLSFVNVVGILGGLSIYWIANYHV